MDNKRIYKIQERLKKERIGAFLISNQSNIFYLSGFRGILAEGECFLVVFRNRFSLIIPEMYSSQAREVARPAEIRIARKEKAILGEAIDILKDKKAIGFEKESLRYSQYEELRKNLKNKKIIPLSGWVEELRESKEGEEINKIKKAAEITDKAFYSILKIIRPGIREKFIQRRIIEIMEDLGADGPSFPPIVASGRNSAEPHYLASGKKITSGLLLIDMGARYKGYCSDFSRTIFIGRASQRIRKLYNIVLAVQEAALEDCHSGYSLKEMYQKAIARFREYKEERYFIHGLGHGVGIDIHESPSINRSASGFLKSGMVVAVEPGLYHKGIGGIRIEDLCLVGRKREILTRASRELIEL